ncbi:hypothetical protein ACHAQH_008725 [Verticillium albo-atrum]
MEPSTSDILMTLYKAAGDTVRGVYNPGLRLHKPSPIRPGPLKSCLKRSKSNLERGVESGHANKAVTKQVHFDPAQVRRNRSLNDLNSAHELPPLDFLNWDIDFDLDSDPAIDAERKISSIARRALLEVDQPLLESS